MFIFMLALATQAPTVLTDIHQRDIACVVEIAVLVNAQKRGGSDGPIVEADGKRWAGVVGDRIMFETGQPRELVAVALNEAATARAGRPSDKTMVASCIQQMTNELAIADAANRPLPQPVKAQ
jgi:hypothetical protein